jgi:hypothetical protein
VRGLLADVNVQGHLIYLRRLLQAMDLWPILAAEQLELATFPELGLPRELDDRTLWHYCQDNGWILFTENRNRDGPDSLQATLDDTWRTGQLPVLTLSNKDAFEHSRRYAERVAEGIAEILIGVKENGMYCDRPRMNLPLD